MSKLTNIVVSRPFRNSRLLAFIDRQHQTNNIEDYLMQSQHYRKLNLISIFMVLREVVKNILVR